MKIFSVPGLLLFFGLFSVAAVAADSPPPKEKSPADVAADAFFKLRDEKDAPPTPDRQTKILSAGMAFLKEFPLSSRANGVINSLATFGATMKDKNQASQRLAWISRVQYEAHVQGSTADLPKGAAAACKALAAAASGALLKESPTKDNIVDFREKIDRLAETPDSARFLPDQERAFIQFLKNTNNAGLAEKHATRLLASTDKKLAAMAQEELNLLTIAKSPLELSFTSLEGKEVDVAKLRGKVVYFVFWTTGNEASTKELLALKETYGENRGAKFEMIAVCLDEAADRTAVEAWVKKNKIKCPVWFAGTGMANELGAKLNVTKVPASALFDAKGIFISTGVKSGSLPGQLKKLLGTK